jgi:cell division protease FtsH
MGDLLVYLRDGIAAWLPLFFAVLLVLMVYILWRTLQVMPRVTAAKTITSDSNVTWDDVAGLDEAKEELHEVVDFCATRSASVSGARVPKGILLYGPPEPEDAAREGDRERGGSALLRPERLGVVEMFAGPGAARIRKLSRGGAQERPAIVFIDELDAVGAQRTGHGFSREQGTRPSTSCSSSSSTASRRARPGSRHGRLQPSPGISIQRCCGRGASDRQVLVAAPDLAGREQISASTRAASRSPMTRRPELDRTSDGGPDRCRA